MVDWGEVFVDGIFGSNAVGGGVRYSGEGITFVFEDEAANNLRVELDDDWRRGVLLRWNGEGIDKGRVEGWNEVS